MIRKMPGLDPDATYVIRRESSRSASRRFPYSLAAAGALALLLIGGLIVALRPQASAPQPASLAAPELPRADEAQLLAADTSRTTLWRFAPDPVILVMIFPSLHEQALTLDRVAEFVERAQAPHDRVLGDHALRGAIAATGDDFDTVYVGHDYRAADLRRFFTFAARDHVALDPEERQLRRQMRDQGLLADGSVGALISLPPSGTGILDAPGRATILRHELSHGLYFTDRAYNDYVRSFWESTMTDQERNGMRGFLASEGYDRSIEDLMRNEGQAYLIHTSDPRFFRADLIGMDQASEQALRDRFIAGMPAGWLRDRTKP